MPPSPWLPMLAFFADCDGTADDFLNDMASRCEAGLRRIFAHCRGFTAGTDLMTLNQVITDINTAGIGVTATVAALLLAEHESLKRQARDKKERSESTAQEAGALLDLVRTKQELRTVEVRGEYHPVTRRVCFTRADTGEVIEDRAATTDEISQWVQQEIDFAPARGAAS